MKLRAQLLAFAATVMLVAGSLIATTTPAAAAVCPAGKLCLWEDPNFVDLDVTSTSTAACIYLDLHNGTGYVYGETGFANGIGSYVNNLPVNAVVYEKDYYGAYYLNGTIRPGGSSSNTGHVYFGQRGAVCMGGYTP